MDEAAEKAVHAGERSLYFLVFACFLGDDLCCGLSTWRRVRCLLCFVVCLLGVGDKQLGHMIDDHRDPLAVHDVHFANSLKSRVALLVSCEDLIGIASAIPAALLIEEPRVLQKVGGPNHERLPVLRVFSDARAVQMTLRLHEVLRDLLVIHLVLPLDLHLRIKQLDNLGSTAHLHGLRQREDPLAC